METATEIITEITTNAPLDNGILEEINDNITDIKVLLVFAIFCLGCWLSYKIIKIFI
ncbi:MAG: hypothetical protein IJ583_04420 [Firmicutes bacterium]|nr:hypothetical protein [Bacillota bacterium]